MVVGWREWVALPQLDIPAIKAKIDTGAKTSALHAHYIEPFSEGGIEKIKFGIRPIRKRTKLELHCVADILDRRVVSDSGGHREERFVIQTIVELAGARWPIEMTLTNRDTMLFRMLLGRSAMADRFIVQPGESFLHGRRKSRDYYPLAQSSESRKHEE